MRQDGFQSEALADALVDALGGKPTELERLLCVSGAVVTSKPNLKLAAAFGAEIGACSRSAVKLLRRLGGEDAAPDTDRAFLPMAAAHGWTGLLRAGREVESAWAALADLAADERVPVRLGTLDALLALASREGGADIMVQRGCQWLDAQDDSSASAREHRFGTAAMAMDVLTDPRVLSRLRDTPALLRFLERALGEIENAPRSSERSDARRRLLIALPRALSAALSNAAAGPEVRAWFEGLCESALQPDVREILSDAILGLRSPERGQNASVIAALRLHLEGSAKPLRYAARIRPGSGRGKASRRMR